MPSSNRGATGQETAADAQFQEGFAKAVAERDYAVAMALCRDRLSQHPGDRYALEMRATVRQFLDAVEDLEDAGATLKDEEEPTISEKTSEQFLMAPPCALEPLEAPPPPLAEIREQMLATSERALQALSAYFLEDEARLWKVGEQTVGIFWDAGQICSRAPLKARLHEISVDLTRRLLQPLQAHGGPKEKPGEEEMDHSAWFCEALGQLWWYFELGLEPDPWLFGSCSAELVSSGGDMQRLLGYSLDSLRKAEEGELCDILTNTWTLERTLVCGLLGSPPPVELEYGVAAVLAEIRRRPLVEPPLSGFYDCFYLMTHVVYVLSCFNGHLPNYRQDCPWVYAYIERALGFWIRELRRDAAQVQAGHLPASVVAHLWSADAVDAIAESCDCLLGLKEPPDEESDVGRDVRVGLRFLMDRQGQDGLMFSPGSAQDPNDEYNYVHPSWTAAAALQSLSREAPGPSQRCALWSRHARAAAVQVGFSEPPPSSNIGAEPVDAEVARRHGSVSEGTNLVAQAIKLAAQGT